MCASHPSVAAGVLPHTAWAKKIINVYSNSCILILVRYIQQSIKWIAWWELVTPHVTHILLACVRMEGCSGVRHNGSKCTWAPICSRRKKVTIWTHNQSLLDLQLVMIYSLRDKEYKRGTRRRRFPTKQFEKALF